MEDREGDPVPVTGVVVEPAPTTPLALPLPILAEEAFPPAFATPVFSDTIVNFLGTLGPSVALKTGEVTADVGRLEKANRPAFRSTATRSKH